MIFAVVLLLIGVGVLAYPPVSDYVNRLHGSYAIQTLQEQVGQATDTQLAEQRRLAQSYNADPSQSTVGYQDILDYGGGIMGYIDIPSIDVHLPIYHGVDSDVLAKGVGHLPESSFPIGGEGNHAVLTGHTGLPGAHLFTDLTELDEGDEFSIHILEEELTYRVDQITVVLSHETGDLAPRAGKDYCTLVTCTPYGINSHRLLVRGERVESAQAPVVEVPDGAKETANWLWALAAVPVVPLGILEVFLVRKRRRRAG